MCAKLGELMKIKIDRDFTKNRSDKYQHVLVEAPCSPDMISEFSDARGIAGMVNDPDYDEELSDLRSQLKVELWRVIKTKLTNNDYSFPD